MITGAIDSVAADHIRSLAANGVPTEIKGLSGFDTDKDVLRLESTIRDGIQPRILGLRTRVVEELNERPVLVVRVPKSWAGPHMVTYKGTSRFFGRSSAGKFQMDVDELRSAFALTGSMPERIRAWRDERVANVIAGETPVPLADAAKMILHLVPLESFDDPYRIAASDFDPDRRPVPMGVNSWSHRLNLDGFVAYGAEPLERSYCQVFRSGRVEAVYSDLVRLWDGNPAMSPGYEGQVVEATNSYIRLLNALDVHPPIVLMLTLVGVRGARLAVRKWDFRDAHPIDRDVLVLPDVLIDEMPVDVARLIQPTFDAVWNACGLLRSFNYDDDGNWAPR